jgi:hypothetical protein
MDRTSTLTKARKRWRETQRGSNPFTRSRRRRYGRTEAEPAPEPQPDHRLFLEKLAGAEDLVPCVVRGSWKGVPRPETVVDRFGTHKDTYRTLFATFGQAPLFAMADGPLSNRALEGCCRMCIEYGQAYAQDQTGMSTSTLAAPRVRRALVGRLDRWIAQFFSWNAVPASRGDISLSSLVFWARMVLESTLPATRSLERPIPSCPTILHFFQLARTCLEMFRCNRFRCGDVSHAHQDPGDPTGGTASSGSGGRLPVTAAEAWCSDVGLVSGWGAEGLLPHLQNLTAVQDAVARIASLLVVSASDPKQWDSEWLEGRWKEREAKRLAELVARHDIELNVKSLFDSRVEPVGPQEPVSRPFRGDRVGQELREVERLFHVWQLNHEEAVEESVARESARQTQDGREPVWREQEPENRAGARGSSPDARMLAVLGQAAALTHWSDTQFSLLRRRPCRAMPRALLAAHVRELRLYLNHRLRVEPSEDMRFTMIDAFYRHNLAGGALEQYLQSCPEQPRNVPPSTVLNDLFHPEHVRAVQKSFNDRTAGEMFRDREHPFRGVVDLTVFGCCFEISCSVPWLDLYCVWNYDFLVKRPGHLWASRRGARSRRPVIVSLAGQWWAVTDRENVACRSAEEATAVWVSALHTRHQGQVEDRDLDVGRFVVAARGQLDEDEERLAAEFWGVPSTDKLH